MSKILIFDKVHYFLNIGSNLGNRKLNISRALSAIEKKFGYFETSSIIESRPWGFVSDNLFSNIAVMVISDLRPTEVLAEIKKIEAELGSTSHRDSNGAYTDRIIDIDIMAADEIILDSPELKIPHPHLAQREFFLKPFAELAPMWRHPVTGQTCEEMLSDLPIPED